LQGTWIGKDGGKYATDPLFITGTTVKLGDDGNSVTVGDLTLTAKANPNAPAKSAYPNGYAVRGKVTAQTGGSFNFLLNAGAAFEIEIFLKSDGTQLVLDNDTEQDSWIKQ
jgi:hypothetical protein